MALGKQNGGCAQTHSVVITGVKTWFRQLLRLGNKISLVNVAALGDQGADSLLRLPLLRAMFFEWIGQKVDMIRETNELFLLGLHENFLLDLYLRSVTWVSEVLAEIPVTA